MTIRLFPVCSLINDYKVFPCVLLRVTLVPSGNGDDEDDADAAADDDFDGAVCFLKKRGQVWVTVRVGQTMLGQYVIT